ncbi:MAG: stage II sporulation protein R [Oscillospiraceae bacterium]|nr:stage II sporulation protein R [Oscillospiraceae bacterium]
MMKEQTAFWKKVAVLLVSLLLAAATLVAVSALGEFRVRCEDISQKVLRLHVLANSNSETDQQLKLKVRDAILKESGQLFGTSKEKADTMQIVEQHYAELEQVARRTLLENGCDLPVTVSLEKTYFNTRTYGEITMPSGYYDALQVKIGAASGKNWWCVLFPAICVPSATNVQMEDVLTPEELDVVEQQGYDVRFKVVEWYEAVAGWFR